MEIKLTPNAILKPTMPPGPIEGFVDSEILLDLIGIPAEIGNCTITGVRVTVMNPDNAIATVGCTREGDGTWSCTLPASTKSGRMTTGVQILLDGTTPDGGSVDGYVLAVCPLVVYTRDGKTKPTGSLLKWWDEVPTSPKKGDVAEIDDSLKLYTGTEWKEFGTEVDLTDYYTKEETDEQIDKLAAYYITADAQGNNFATRAALLNAETYYSGGVARVPTRNDYAVVLADETHSGAEWRYIYAVAEGQTTGQWEAQYPIETNDYTALSNKPQINGTTLEGNKTPAQLGLASRGDVTLTARGEGGSGYSDWSFDPDEFLVPAIYFDRLVWNNGIWEMHGHPDGIAADLILTQVAGPEHAVRLDFPKGEYTSTAVTATRTAYGYIVGDPNDSTNPNRNKPVARQEDLDAANEVIAKNQATAMAAIASVAAALPYALATAVTIDSAQTDTSGGTTINYGAVTCANRTDHPVAITAALDELRITFPAAVANHVRDFYLRIDVGTGSAALTAPAIVPVAPTGETITVEAPGGTMPVLADGTATAKGTTMLYFSETAPGKFWAKAETIEEVA